MKPDTHINEVYGHIDLTCANARKPLNPGNLKSERIISNLSLDIAEIKSASFATTLIWISDPKFSSKYSFISSASIGESSRDSICNGHFLSFSQVIRSLSFMGQLIDNQPKGLRLFYYIY